MFEWHSWGGLFLAVLIAVVVALAAIALVSVLSRVIARRREWPKALASGARHPFRLLLVVIAAWIAVYLTSPDPDWRAGLNHSFLVIVIAITAWLVGGLISFAIGLAMTRYRTDIPDNKVARRMQTQLAIVRRLAFVVVVVLAIGGILLTFPGVQAVGASVLASAGVVSVVAGLAAQSTLANVFAGVQLAFSDAIRVEDVVIADGEWGRIEEITLTYVVMHLWDDRRMVFPSTYFTSTPFQNWTRNSSELLGAVDLDLDWRVSPSAMRQQLETVLARSENWDGRASVLQVTDAVGGFVRVRILVSAIDAPTLFDLRCYVREEMVEWIQEQDPAGLPRSRVQLVEAEPRRMARPTEKTHTDQVGLFTGTADAEERASLFTKSIPVIPQETDFETADELPDGEPPGPARRGYRGA